MKVLAHVEVTGDFNEHEMTNDEKEEMLDDLAYTAGEATNMSVLINPVTDMGNVSDGYHTFNELYYHRMMLFAVICNTYKTRAWKSWKHDDGTMFDNYFIVGVETVEGHYTYHYHKDHWDLFKVLELEFAPKWDGHKPEDITRLLSLIK